MVVGESGLGKTTLISTLFSELVTCEKLQQASFLPLCQRWLQQQILTNFEKLDESMSSAFRGPLARRYMNGELLQPQTETMARIHQICNITPGAITISAILARWALSGDTTIQEITIRLKQRLECRQVTGDLNVSFEEVLVLNVDASRDDMIWTCADFFILRGKTYDYKLLFQSIARLFLLPKDDQHVLFISKKNYEDPTYEFVSSDSRALVGKKIITETDTQGFKANPKAIQGNLFLLERYIFFVSKQPTLIGINDIHQGIFSRVGAGAGASTRRNPRH
ncbi:hypothetical protein BYT27DRAFT_7263851 [Phlegmacium glaucopus]|nr:hypothetical protein BYT27DRAFT_7263851 [Phlegmacium glaucopus]